MKAPIVILHGWGKSGKDYQDSERILKQNGYTVFSPDMPGFGSEALRKTMILDDYVDFVREFLKRKHIIKAIFVGHSFGSRVAAKLSFQYPQLVEKLILTGAPLIRQPLTLKKQIISIVAGPVKMLSMILPSFMQKLLKKSVYRALGEWDYYKAGKLKETFKNIIAEDLRDVLPGITISTFIIWGELDKFVPLTVGKKIAKMIPHSTFVSIPNASHKLPYENPTIFTQHVLRFLKKI